MQVLRFIFCSVVFALGLLGMLMTIGGLSISTSDESMIRGSVFGLAFLVFLFGAMFAFSHIWGLLVIAINAGLLGLASIILSIHDWDITAFIAIGLPSAFLTIFACLLSRILGRAVLVVEEF